MSRGATVPVYSRRRSDSVVFPWSTCAITEIARVSLVGVDTRRSLSGIKKGPARMSRPFGRVVGRLLDAAFTRGLRVGLRRIAHRFATADLFALDTRLLDHQVPPCS